MRLSLVEDRIKELLEDRNIREALDRATRRFAEGRAKTIAELGPFEEVRRRTREVKERALGKAHLLWPVIVSRLVDSGAQVIEAHDASAAREAIWGLLEDTGVKLLVKGKSITSEEIGLNPYLEAKGVEVVETDLGERIIQLKGEKPSHLIVPAVHRTKEEVAELFTEHLGREVPPDPYVITKLVREDLRDRFLRADAGFTGANVVSAEPFSLFLMTNEGNGRLCATLPKLYITLVGYEKLVETVEDALWILKVLPRNSVGLRFASYVSVFRGPFRWRKDRRWVVVVLDNGRRRALEDTVLHHALRCIRCGACLNVCPVYRVVSGLGFSHVYMGGIGVAWTAITEGVDRAYRVSRLCTGCGRCEEVCPVEIPIPRLVEEVRSRAGRDLVERVAPKVMERRNRLLLGASEAAKVLGLYPSRSPFTVRRTSRGEVQLYVGCVVDQLMPQVAEDALEVLDRAFVKVGVSREECCGLPLKVYGDKQGFYRLALKNSSTYRGRRLVFVCDSCLSTFLEYGRHLGKVEFEALSLPEILLEKGVRFRSPSPLKVCVHVPCHLSIHGREEALFELVSAVDGVELVRDEREAECCGGAGLYRYKAPEVAEAVGERKVRMLAEAGCQVVITTCPSCIMQLRSLVDRAGLDVEVVHLASFLKNCLVDA